ncbi:MAG TPA: cytochrome c peroxidase [Gemmatimonadaceae bacterium]|nr:cytochrome c peroxidase [Gemmatimonadaceae bacterium]
MAKVGERIFFDANLSVNRNQSCAACHDPAWGFTGPNEEINRHGAVYQGSIPGAFGDRKPPSSAYATPSPVLSFEGGVWSGGNFWDGRATGQRLGSPSAEQAQGPFLNPAEQALRDAACVVARVARAPYAGLYSSVFGRGIFAIALPPDIDSQCAQAGGALPLGASVRQQVQAEYDNIARAIAAYESTTNTFSSKYDAYLDGRATLTAEERLGLTLFEGKAQCANCHPSEGKRALFTDYTYDNLGAMRNPENPVYARNPGFVDLGLGGFLGLPSEYGKVKVPTLRNVDRRAYPGGPKAYLHNGALKSLEDVVHFYNTRDVLPSCDAVATPQMGVNCWPPPEVSANVNHDELGNLGLTGAEERAIVAFMRTLTDGYQHR